MIQLRIALAVGGAALAAMLATPASAQFFLRSHDFRTDTLKGDPTGISEALPGATDVEKRAIVAWNMRAALNAAALQCQFEPTLLTPQNYNAILTDHKAELDGVWTTLTKYFARNNKTPKAGLAALDQFGTRLYSGFSAVPGKIGFCQTASVLGRDATFVPRGGFTDFATQHLPELRASLVPYGEQHFSRILGRDYSSKPRFDPICWNKKGDWVVKKCGAFNWPPAAVSTSTIATSAAPAAAQTALR
ncbi:hypothetical protein ACU5AX_11510 [Sphingomonas sp. XXL09]|uniref:hypothetical protein n=1 Tax=Sphingomonas sp. XXL09 TaxID=3457787 RepID=UPI00406BB5BC